MKIFIPGGAGLVGLNLLYLLEKNYPDWELFIVDKKRTSIEVGKRLFKNVQFICEDLSYLKGNTWPDIIKNCDICIMLQAEIGNKDPFQFEKNNVISTKTILQTIKKTNIKRVIHISSSVLNSVYSDHYTQTKLKQENLILEKWSKSLVILRPTLMFGWFDRKHLGWLQKFMHKYPLFPIPGKGDFIRQPLFVRDFCKIIESCIVNENISGTYDITGLQQIKYRKLMYLLKGTIKKNPIFNFLPILIFLPIPIFRFLLKIWAFISKNPAFSVSQLEALTSGDEFKVINWPKIFGVDNTDIKEAIRMTYNNKIYSNIELPF